MDCIFYKWTQLRRDEWPNCPGNWKPLNWGYFSKCYFIIPGDGEQWKCRLVSLKELPSNLRHAVGLVSSLKNRASESGTKGGLGMGNKLDCFCQWVKVSMVSWFWKGGCLWLPSLFRGKRCDQEWVLCPLKPLSLALEHILEKAMATHSSSLAWKIPWTEEPGRLQSMGSLRVRHDWATSLSHFHALEKEMATHSSGLAWRIPGMEEPGGLPSMGLHRVGHDWSDLAAAAEQVYLACSNRSRVTQSWTGPWVLQKHLRCLQGYRVWFRCPGWESSE